MLRTALAQGLFTLGSRLVRRQVRRELAVLEWAERADPEELRARQEARLRTLIRWSYDTVPYYRRVMDQTGVSPGDIRGIDDLPLMPVLRRRDIRTHLDALVSERVSKGDLLRRASSGTTGAPVWFYRDRRALPFERASLWHDLRWAGVTAAAPTLFVRRQVDNEGRRKWTRWNWLVGSAFLPPELLYALAPGPVVEAVERVAPALIYGYPSLLHLLARAVLLSGRPLRARPRCVLYDAEQMGDDTRDLVRQAFGAPIFSRYGAREFSAGVAHTCEYGRWHLNTEGSVVEIVTGGPGEARGAPASKGRLVVTDLRNHAMPFVRYEIGDAGAAGGEELCPCGRTLPLLGGLEGRVWEWIVTASGFRIPATMIAPMIVGLHGDLLWEYQFRQDRVEELEVVVVPISDYGENRQEELSRHLEAALAGQITVRVTPVGHIPREPSSKRPVMKSRLDQGR